MLAVFIYCGKNCKVVQYQEGERDNLFFDQDLLQC